MLAVRRDAGGGDSRTRRGNAEFSQSFDACVARTQSPMACGHVAVLGVPHFAQTRGGGCTCNHATASQVLHADVPTGADDLVDHEMRVAIGAPLLVHVHASRRQRGVVLRRQVQVPEQRA